MMRMSVLILTLVATVTNATHRRVASPYNPDNAIRIKEFVDGELCPGGQAHYTGWFDINDRHLFYWLHPARHGKMEDAPLIVWLQGGPGGYSLFGMFVEHGPCIMSPAGGLFPEYNKYAWSEVANVIYIDQPAGVGFSYVDNSTDESRYPERTEASALDFVHALKLLQEGFPELRKVPVHIAGESYAGRYVPEYAAAVVAYNQRVPEASSIKLASLMVGNGWLSPHEQYPALYETGCFTVDGIPPIFNATECSEMAAAVDRCETVLRACEQDPDPLICYSAGKFCDDNTAQRIETKLNNRYNRIQVCPGVSDCYRTNNRLDEWLHTPQVTGALELPPSVASRTSFVESEIIARRYRKSGDYDTSSLPALARVLGTANVSVLMYVGINDWVCNPLGVERSLDRMHWAGHAEFRGTPKCSLPWKTRQGNVGGRIKSVEKLWFVELADAGHLTPYDQPEILISLMRLWLAKTGAAKPLGKTDPEDTAEKLRVQSSELRWRQFRPLSA